MLIFFIFWGQHTGLKEICLHVLPSGFFLSPLFSGFLALLALAIYTGVTVTFFGKRFLDWRFSWSYIIGWVAIILAFAAGLNFIYFLILGVMFNVSESQATCFFIIIFLNILLLFTIFLISNKTRASV